MSYNNPNTRTTSRIGSAGIARLQTCRTVRPGRPDAVRRPSHAIHPHIQWDAHHPHPSRSRRPTADGWGCRSQLRFRDRRRRKRDFRRLWIIRVTAACEFRGLKYSRFINALVRSNIALNRKMLSEIAIDDPAGFDRIVEQAGLQSSQAA